MNRLTAAFVRNKRKQSNIGTLNVLFGWITDRVAMMASTQSAYKNTK